MRRSTATIGALVLLTVALGTPASATPSAATPRTAGCIPWEIVPTPTDSAEEVAGIDGTSASDFWAVEDSFEAPHPATILHWDGTGWTKAPINAKDGDLKSVDVLSENDAWAVGTLSGYQKTLAVHWNGSVWSNVAVPSPVGSYDILYGVSGSGPDDVWAVGVTGYSQGLIAHWHGTTWITVPHPTYQDGEEFRSVATITPDDAWAVGGQLVYPEQPIIEHWDGTSWKDAGIAPVPNGGLLMGVDATGPNDVWAAGIGYGGALVYHWDGTGWTKLDNVPYTPTAEWWGVSARTPNDVWLGGLKDGSGPPRAAHWNGSTWVGAPTTPENQWFITIKAFDAVNVWAGGGGASGIRVERYVGCGS